MYHSFLIHWSANGHPGCFQDLVIVSSAAMNIVVHMSLSILVSLVCMSSSGIAGSYSKFIPSFFLKKSQTGLCGRGKGWDDLGEWHWNMCNIIYEMSRQSRFNARYWMLGAGALGWPRGMVQGGRREVGSGWGTGVYLWQIHVDIWQNQYNIVKLKNKIK